MMIGPAPMIMMDFRSVRLGMSAAYGEGEWKGTGGFTGLGIDEPQRRLSESVPDASGIVVRLPAGGWVHGSGHRVGTPRRHHRKRRCQHPDPPARRNERGRPRRSVR